MNTIHSFVGILLYFSFLIILIYFVYKKKWYLLTHENLFKQKLFILSILVPFSAFVYFGAFAWWGHSLQLDSKGYENFYNISKFPLLLLAMSVPMASIINNIHRTIQTEKQISETQEKNITDNYYSHLKYTTEYFKDLPEHCIVSTHPKTQEKILKTLKINYPTKLYDRLFPKSNPHSGASYEVNRHITSSILDCNNRINLMVKELDETFSAQNSKPISERIKVVLTSWHNIEIRIKTICGKIGISNYDFGFSIIINDEANLIRTNIIDVDDLCQTISAIQELSISILERIGEITFTEDYVLHKYSNHLDSLKSNRRFRSFIERNLEERCLVHKKEIKLILEDKSGDTLAAENTNSNEKILTKTNQVTDL